MGLDNYVQIANDLDASDLHLEPGLPMAVRVAGELKKSGEPLTAPALREIARSFLGPAGWNQFVEHKSVDLARTIAGVRCRVNILKSSRGVGFAIRLLATNSPTLESLNLHPALRELVDFPSGLVIFSGSTGCGKTSTMAALIDEVNRSRSDHIVTIERPIEFLFPSKRAFIRQREVGRDTPSFDRAIHDALREDPDLLMVGEMRHAETIRWTLTAAETGHLVMATLHSSNGTEALQRIIKAFAPEIQHSITSQLAGTLRAIVSQKLVFREDLGFRVPVLEIVRVTNPIRSLIRSGNFFQLENILETGQKEGQFTFRRYEEWTAQKHDWVSPEELRAQNESEVMEAIPEEDELEPVQWTEDKRSEPSPEPPRPKEQGPPDNVIVIDPPSESLSDILSEFED